MDFVEQEYWDNAYKGMEIESIHQEDSIIRFIHENLPHSTDNKSIFEIGCFPGRYMSIFGQKGYELNGIDLTPRTHELREILKKKGYKIGNIEQGDFLKSKLSRFDIVCSFGFIEHFQDFSNVIEKHLELVNDNGYVLIATPNFRGILQYFYHAIFDKENLKKHNTKSMRPFLWKRLIEKKGFKIIDCGFLGDEVWKDSVTRNNILFRKAELYIIKLLKLVTKFKPHNALSTGYCIIFAKKI